MTLDIKLAPHLTPQSQHLSEAQFGELLAQPAQVESTGLAEAHLQDCEQCTEELAGLRESLSLLRYASTAYADDQLRRLPPMPAPARPLLTPVLRPAYLAIAAALVLAAFLPMQMLWQRSRLTAPPSTSTGTTVQVYATESNEALLNDVDREVSASVPSAMQELADPTDATDLADPNSTQRKD
jgi:hypothetical protein